MSRTIETTHWAKCDMCGSSVELGTTAGHPDMWTFLEYRPFPDTNSTPATYDLCPACSHSFEAWRTEARKDYK